jgi:hypothetical protein
MEAAGVRRPQGDGDAQSAPASVPADTLGAR